MQKSIIYSADKHFLEQVWVLLGWYWAPGLQNWSRLTLWALKASADAFLTEWWTICEKSVLCPLSHGGRNIQEASEGMRTELAYAKSERKARMEKARQHLEPGHMGGTCSHKGCHWLNRAAITPNLSECSTVQRSYNVQGRQDRDGFSLGRGSWRALLRVFSIATAL